jgi:CheY-like chemotaxis protein
MTKRRILIVDDEVGFIRMLKLALERTDRYQVHGEIDPARVLEVATDFRPDLIVLDLLMPGLDGGDLANQIRAHPRLQSTPILFLSSTVLQREGHPVQIVGYPAVAKPIGMSELIRQMEIYLPKARES